MTLGKERLELGTSLKAKDRINSKTLYIIKRFLLSSKEGASTIVGRLNIKLKPMVGNEVPNLLQNTGVA
jgi:hypothetical protein